MQGNTAVDAVDRREMLLDAFDPTAKLATQRLARFVCLGILAFVNIGLVFSQLAFFPVFSGLVDVYFHSLLYFVPFAATALYLTLPEYMAMAAGLGLATCIHANVMPIDYYEVGRFSNPLAALLLSCFGALIIWAATHGAMRWFERRGQVAQAEKDVVRTESPLPRRRRALVIVGSMLLSSLCISFCFDVLSTIVMVLYSLGIDDSMLFLLQETLKDTSFWAQVLFDWVFMGAAAIVADIWLQKLLKHELKRTLRSVFRRWLLLVVMGAFIATNTLSFCIETVQAVNNADLMLDSQLTYLTNQVGDYIAQQSMLKKSEDTLVLSKARSAARIIQLEPGILESQEHMERLREAIGVTSVTVCDDTGTVIVDADANGVQPLGYNFAENPSTMRYLNLIDGTVGYIVEEPRNSVDINGNETDEIRVFAGVPRLESKGFVQISIEAEEYSKALSAVSIDKLADDYSFGSNGVVVIAHNGEIVSSNDPELKGARLAKAFGLENMYDVLDEETVEDYAEAYTKEYLSGDMQTIQDVDTMAAMYIKGCEHGTYKIFVISPAKDVFSSRTSTIVLNALCYLMLFGVVFALTNTLLDNVVVRGFVRTNGVLALITEGDLEQRIEEHGTEEFDSLSDGINATVGALKESIAEAESRYDQELATAKAIQESALPSTFPPFPEVEAFDIHASMNAAKEVGGDFYDFFLIDDHTLGFLIADVSGKGIPASLFMMTAKTQLENYMMTGMDLAEAIGTANHHLCIGNDAGMFVTVWAATLDWKTGELTYVNAGHNPPLLRHGGSWEWLTKRCGLFLGTFETAKYRAASLTLEKGDELYLYTDGVNEAFSVGDEEYGNDRLEALLSKHTNDHPRTLIEAVRDDLADWTKGAEQSDDITMLSLEYGEAPEVMASITVPARIEQLERVRSFVHAELGRRLCPLGVQNKLDIALEEMFVNVCHYAYADKDEPGSVTVSYVYTPNPTGMTIEIDDTGIPFDPLTRSDPTLPTNLADIKIGGLGIMMTRKCVDDISYVRADGHNHLSFTKRW